MKQTRLLIMLFVVLLTACQNINRPFVITNPQQLGDLYCHGELTDTVGNRWSVYILPGARNMVDYSIEGFKDAGKNLQEYSDKDFFCDLQTMSTDSLEFSKESLEFSRDSITEFWLEGTGDDFAEASENISMNFREAPFGWIPRIIGNVAWGYIFMPALRVSLMPVGVTLGLSGATLGVVGSAALPTGGFLAPPIKAIGNVVFNGIFIPLVGMTAHQFIYLLVLPNREPAEDMDGRFGLHIINHKEHSSYDDEHYDDDNLIEGSLIDSDAKIDSNYTVDTDYIKKTLDEYILLSGSIAELKMKADNIKNLNIYVNMESSSWERKMLDKEAEKYVRNSLRQDFSEKWNLMKNSLPPEATLDLNEQAAYEDFVYIIHLNDVLSEVLE